MTWDSFRKNVINPLIGWLIFAAVIAGVVLTWRADRAQHDRDFDTFEQIYSPVGLFNQHPLEALGPNEVVDASFSGTYFSALTIGSGQISGHQDTVLVLRFKWIAPNGAHKVKEYPYESINLFVDDSLTTPVMVFNFSPSTKSSEYRVNSDLTVYDYNVFFGYTESIDVYMNQTDYDYEMSRLQIK